MGLVEGPTFESQFSPSWDSNALPGAIEATTSPAAYLIELLQFAQTRGAAVQADASALAEGDRPNLTGIVLPDDTASDPAAAKVVADGIQLILDTPAAAEQLEPDEVSHMGVLLEQARERAGE
ncbi:Tc toxin subunit A [Streptomyces citrinus]|uniref:Tc toxin subunit A n=1 Tax=Streptomyces citrinus TaxID=3118173 RepID=A0ACD5AR23_9ACTN